MCTLLHSILQTQLDEPMMGFSSITRPAIRSSIAASSDTLASQMTKVLWQEPPFAGYHHKNQLLPEGNNLSLADTLCQAGKALT